MFKLPAAPRSDFSADESAQPASSAVEVSYFTGLLTRADEAKIFDASARFRQDRNGNRVSPVAAVDGTLMSVIKGKRAVNWLARSPGGAISSSVDADGDGVVDLLDSITANRDRLIVVNGLGLELLKKWRDGIDPLCQPLPGFGGQPLFGCDDSGSPAGGSANGAGGRNPADPFGDICKEYRGGSRFGRPGIGVYAHGGHGFAHLGRVGGLTQYWQNEDGTRTRLAMVGIRVYFDEDGHHVSTYRETRYWNTDGDLVRTIEETVDHTGEGTRTVTDHHADRTESSRTSRFRTTVNDDGTYDTPSVLNDPDAPESHKQLYENADEEHQEDIDVSWPASITGATADPGAPDMDADADWQTWCERTESGQNPSGIEGVTDENLGVFDREICVNSPSSTSSTGSSSGQNCITIDSSRLMDLESILEPPSAGSNCGRFEQPGPDGTCGPASGLVRFLGRHVNLSALKLDGVRICDPLVCRPGFLD